MSLNGDEIGIGLRNTIREYTATVGDKIEAAELVNNPRLNDLGVLYQVDVDSDAFDVIITNNQPNSLNLPAFDVSLEDLDWVDLPDGFITDIVPTLGEGVFSTEFSDDSIVVSLNPPAIDPEESYVYSFEIVTECFLPGTNILTNRGEVAVEKLKIGDLVQTATGELEAIKWIGKQTVNPQNITNPLRSNPIMIQAGAFGNSLPARDLYTSPDHAYLVDGLLINAGALVNDVSILKTEIQETFCYYHVELENHALLIAEGIAAESYLPQKENRNEYDNAEEYQQLYPESINVMLFPMDYPRISSKNKVPRQICHKLMQIASQLHDTAA